MVAHDHLAHRRPPFLPTGAAPVAGRLYKRHGRQAIVAAGDNPNRRLQSQLSSPLLSQVGYRMGKGIILLSIGRPSSPRKSQHGETSDRHDDPQEHDHITSDLNNPCMKVDFLRWEEGDPIGWISHTECCFRFYRTVDATRMEIAAIHLKGDAIQ
ncbi:hypothetical protein B296_00010059 [Ensete ventricosum]|uniref:Uncharacterized protein n=1 Tax=Ensete ventricosum TaxID=4639 RepID=A0A426ZJ70_ENSVE|nr:hypothetical protein B296_00010059 [Ensete ventricosum]